MVSMRDCWYDRDQMSQPLFLHCEKSLYAHDLFPIKNFNGHNIFVGRKSWKNGCIYYRSTMFKCGDSQFGSTYAWSEIKVVKRTHSFIKVAYETQLNFYNLNKDTKKIKQLVFDKPDPKRYMKECFRNRSEYRRGWFNLIQ